MVREKYGENEKVLEKSTMAIKVISRSIESNFRLKKNYEIAQASGYFPPINKTLPQHDFLQ